MKDIASQKQIQIMALLGVVWMIVFNYFPMYGLIHFKEFVQDDYFWIVIKNTLGISLIKLIIGFPLPIIFALLLNELTSLKFKKMVQTITYLPHFLSWVVLGGILTTWLADIGI